MFNLTKEVEEARKDIPNLIRHSELVDECHELTLSAKTTKGLVSVTVVIAIRIVDDEEAKKLFDACIHNILGFYNDNDAKWVL